MPPAVQQRSFSDLETLLMTMWVTRLSYSPELLISALPSLSVMEVRSSSPETRNTFLLSWLTGRFSFSSSACTMLAVRLSMLRLLR